MNNDSVTLKGSLIITHSLTGEVLRRRDNMIVASGLNFSLMRLFNNDLTIMTHIAVGSGITPPADGQPALISELGRVPFQTSPAVQGKRATMAALFAPGVASGLWAETGIFNAPSAGVMLNRATFTPFTKTADMPLTISWQIDAVDGA